MTSMPTDQLGIVRAVVGLCRGEAHLSFGARFVNAFTSRASLTAWTR
jgi:hypothetical protein